MTTELETLFEQSTLPQNLVYVRRLELEEAKRIVPAEAFDAISEPDDLFSVHDADGQRLAIVEGREAAFETARAHDLRPRSVH